VECSIHIGGVGGGCDVGDVLALGVRGVGDGADDEAGPCI
jgi:hypothetical protein